MSPLPPKSEIEVIGHVSVTPMNSSANALFAKGV